MNNIKAGTARVVTGAHYGWKDWLAQRITGMIIALWVVLVMLRFIFTSDYSFAGWNGFMGSGIMKTLTVFTILSAAYHAWIGVRDVWMDYFKCAYLRLALHIFTILWLVGCVVYSLAAVLAI